MSINKINFDGKSIGAKLCLYFIFFIILSIGILWILQTIFLVHYYQGMKIESIKKISDRIVRSYGTDEFESTLQEVSLANDIFVQVEDGNTVLFAPSSNAGRSLGYIFLKEMEEVRTHLFENAQAERNSNVSSYMLIEEKNSTGKKVIAYARFLSKDKGEEVILYIFSPLYPVDSTVIILRRQLLYVSLICVMIAIVFSVFFSQRVSKPIRAITSEAEHLAKGEFNFTASDKDYTQIRHLSEVLNKAAFDLKRTERLQRDVLANVSHDLKTPLTMIKSYAEMLRDISWSSEEKREKHLKVIIDEVDRLNLLVSDIVEVSGWQSGERMLSYTKFVINDLIKEIVEKNQAFYSNDGYNFFFEAVKEIEICADEEKIKRVLNNLTDNAIKFTGNDKVVKIVLSDLGAKIRVDVVDSGQGIPEESQSIIWERYQKVSDNHCRNTSGTGLGLAIVKEIILAHGGECGLESSVGKGSRFYFEIDKNLNYY